MSKQFGSISVIGKKLYIDCRIYGERVRYGSKLPDNTENRKKLEDFFERIEQALNDGTFRFKNFFQRAKQKDLNKFALIEAKLFKKAALSANELTVKEYIETWLLEEEQAMNSSTKTDYRDLINSRINPMIGHLTFAEITGKALKVFVRNLKHADGPKQGEYLSAKRMRNILTLFHRIFLEACCEFNWNLKDSFPIAFNRVRRIEKMVHEKGHSPSKTREVWLLSEWQAFIQYVPDHYKPFFELLRTGVIFSEAKGLKKANVFHDHIDIVSSIARGVEKESAKTTFRIREIPLTARLKEIINQAMRSSQTEYVFTMEDGVTPLNYTTIREDIWAKALSDAGLPHRAMYSLRHTFVGWMVLLGTHSTRLKELTGHASRSKLTEDTYGNFRAGLPDEKEDILNFLGRDVLTLEEFKRSFPHIYLQENGIEVACKSAAVELSPETMQVLTSMVAKQIGAVSRKGPEVVSPFDSLMNGRADGYNRVAL